MGEDLNWDERKQWAKLLYTKADKTTGEISVLTGIPFEDIRKWAEDEEWEGIKRLLLTTKQAQLVHLYNLLQYLNEVAANDKNKITLKQVELIAKCTAAIRNLEDENAMGYIILAAEQFTNWLLKIDSEFAKKVTVHFDAFIRENLARE